MRIAAIDIGTNSVHMIVVRVRPDLSFEIVDREKEMVRLGHARIAISNRTPIRPSLRRGVLRRVTARTLVGTLIVAAGTVPHASAQESDLIAPGAKVERLATGFGFLEGPAADADGALYFSDVVNQRIHRWSPQTGVTTFRERTGRANGLRVDLDGTLLVCEMDTRQLTAIDQDGQRSVLADAFEGQRFNSPNDICVDGRGRVYFTDPCYGDRSTMEMELEGVYRIDTDGSVTRILAQPQIERPNGIAVTQDSRQLYVIDSCPTIGGNRKVWGFDLDESGNPSNQRVVYDFGSGRGGDGMRLDADGNLLVAAGIMIPRGPHESDEVPPGIYIISPAGELLGRIPVYEDVLTNLAFGGRDGRTLYITAGKSLFTTRVSTPGQVAYPKWSD